MTNELETLPAADWRPRIMIVGTVLGALVGLAAAYLYIQNNTREDEPLRMSAGEGVKLGVLVFGLLRSIAGLGEGK